MLDWLIRGLEGIAKDIALWAVKLIFDIVTSIVKFLGKLLLFLVDFLTDVASYNNFLDSEAVRNGWVLVRDVANMFFVLILLIIAIATILKVETYSYKKALSKFILMAIFINFSKTICGILIDFGQVIMLTFVNAFKAASGANFIQAFGAHKLFSINADQLEAAGFTGWNIFGALALSLTIALVSVATVGTLAIVLLIRVIALWTLIILSPLAFLLAAFPGGQSYAKEWWWKNFSKYVLVGPLLAFFIWLALLVAGGGQAYQQVNYEAAPDFQAQMSDLGELADPQQFSSFIVAVALLLVGLTMTQKLGIVGSEVAGAALSGLRRAGTAPARWAWKRAKGGVKLVGKGVAAGYNRGAEALYAKTGMALPGSKLRAEQKRERRARLLERKEVEGDVRAARLAEKGGGVRAFLAMAASPRTRKDLTMLESIGAVVGRERSRTRFHEANKKGREAASDRLAVRDPLKAAELSKKYDLKDAKREARAAEKEAAKYDKRKTELEKQEETLSGRISKNQARRDEISKELSENARLQGLSDEDLAGQIPDLDKKVEERVKEVEMMRAEVGRPGMTDTEREVQRRAQRQNLIKEKREQLARQEKRLRGEDKKLSNSIDVDTTKLESVVQELRRMRGAESEYERLTGVASGAKAEMGRLEGRKGEIEEALAKFAATAKLRPLTATEIAEKDRLTREHVTIEGNIKVQAETLKAANRDLAALLERHKDLQAKMEAMGKAQAARQKVADLEAFFKLAFSERYKIAVAEAKAAKKRVDEDALLQGIRKILKGAKEEEVKAVKAAITQTAGGGAKT